MKEIYKIEEGNYFRTYSGLIGKVLDIVCMIDGLPYIGFKNNNGTYCLINIEDIKKHSKDILDLLEYEDVLKVYNKKCNGYMYYGYSKNSFSNIKELKKGISANKNMMIVGIISKEKLKDSFFHTEEKVCTIKEQETCQREKLGCKGCFYNLK